MDSYDPPADTMNTFFATAPRAIEPLLAQELREMGAAAVKPGRGGVTFHGDLAMAYRACLWSRTASRVLLPLGAFPAADSKALYEGVRAVPWEQHLAPEGTLAVDFVSFSSHISHTQFGAQRVKDGVADYFRDRVGFRPSVDRDRPDLRLNVYLLHDVATINVDLSGDSLHRRGYREQSVLAPLKETLAAALLLKMGWPVIAAAGGPFVDPMCGSGTLPIEAALIAADVAPGLLRDYWGFLGWLGHDPALWEGLLAEARERRERGMADVPPILGSDADPQAVGAARANADKAGVDRLLHLECRELAEVQAPRGRTPGLLLVNPPYGARQGEIRELAMVYGRLGEVLKARFPGWQAGVLTGNPELGKRMELRTRLINTFYNGPLTCRLLRFSVESAWFADRSPAPVPPSPALIEEAEMFVNRLRKNLRSLGSWAEREGIACYRLYDADIPEYAVAVDVYGDWVHVQEYQAPPAVDPQRTRERLAQVMAVLPIVLEVPKDRVLLKIRRRQKGPQQYQKQADNNHFLEIREGACRFLVNLSDYLDTGLFLDQRLTRQLIGGLARGRRFLNLFAYTGSATVYAALGGARSTTTVDMSQNYLLWAQRNLALNGIGGRQHDLARCDCLEWLDKDQGHYDLIFLDPPTFSNSKRMSASFDVQRDHVTLIQKTLQRLDEGGILIFCNNYRRFRLDQAALVDLDVEDLSRQTLPRDFWRNPRIHHCWKIARREPHRL